MAKPQSAESAAPRAKSRGRQPAASSAKPNPGDFRKQRGKAKPRESAATNRLDEQLLTVRDVARRHRTGREQVHRWIRAGELQPVIRIGRLIRITPDALADFERRHTTGIR